MSLKNILVSMPLREEYKAQFAQALPQAKFTYAKYADLSPEELSEFDGVVGNPDTSTLAMMPKLKLLQLMSSGVAGDYMKLKDSHPDTVLCSASGAYGQAISEHMVGALMMLLKKLHLYRDAMKSGAWESKGTVYSPRGMRVLIVGAGSIGTDFGKLMQALGSYTIALRRTPGGETEGFDEVHTTDQLNRLLPTVDVVALSLPETPQTIDLFNDERFALMKDGSYLLNVGRGSAVNQNALVRALQSGKLAGASIDVTTPEPLPKDHPLWQQENLLLTPHISGFYYLKATHDNVINIACDNLKAWPEGPFTSRTSFETGYRER